MRARVYLDEDVIPELARLLRSSGHDVVSAHEIGALGIGDEEQLLKATEDGRALLSFNYRHYLEIARNWFRNDKSHAGIIISYRQYRRRELRELAKATTVLLDTLSAEELVDSIWVLDQFRQ